jgi:hypothetical protein
MRDYLTMLFGASSTLPYGAFHLDLARRRWLVILPGAAAALAVAAVIQWRTATSSGGQTPVEPFRIAGNLYRVGAGDVTAFPLMGLEGHIF